MQCFCEGLIVAPCVLQHNAGFTVKCLQMLGKRSQSIRVAGNIERQPNDLDKGTKYSHFAPSAGNIDTCCGYKITPV